MSLDKLPRNVLIPITGALLALSLFFANRAVADSDKLKSIAYQAKNNSDKALESIAEMKLQIADIRLEQKTFGREYNTDQKELDKKLNEILRAAKA